MYVHVCKNTTRGCSKYEHEHHTDHSKKTDIEFNNIKDCIIPCKGTHAQGTSGSIRTSNHSALLEVVDHSWCRKVFVVPSLEHPLEEDDDPEDEEEEDDVGGH